MPALTPEQIEAKLSLYKERSGCELDAAVIDDLVAVARQLQREKQELGLQKPKWRCSGCGYITQENIGSYKGYCFDASGKSCDAIPCPNCKKLHYWSGSD